jgi:hypothetical protein
MNDGSNFNRFPPEVEPMTLDEWSSVLTLSMMWQMDNVEHAVKQMRCLSASMDDWVRMLKVSTSNNMPYIRERAIDELEDLAVTKKIMLARECNILSWLLEGYKKLVTRNEMISEWHEEQLGVGVTMKLLRMREKHYRPGSFDVNTAIKAEFGRELALSDYSYTFIDSADSDADSLDLGLFD